MNRSNVIRSLCLAGTAMLGITASSAQAAVQQQLSVATADGAREYILATPAQPVNGPRPLVILLHGHIGTAANALGQGKTPSPLSAWLNIADREQLLVVAAQGLKGSDNHTGWHDCRLDATEDPTADDVGFIERVVGGLVQAGRADPHRIYVMGMSNGGMMSYRVALEMHPAPAAIAAVSSTMAGQTACGETPRPLSVLMINGTDDPIVPYGGGKVGLRGYKTGTVIGADATRDFWLRADGLSGAPAVGYNFPHLNPADNTRANRLTWGPASGLQVEVITIQNGGHIEPSLVYHYGWLYHQLVGAQNSDFESAEEAWSFFRNKSSR